MSDQNKQSPDIHRAAANRIDNATQAVQDLAKQIKDDPLRPDFHFRAPAGWMNDLHAIFHDGSKYHIFYQHNPYKDYWDTLHWGHAVSKDLLHWEHMPVALSPAPENNEAHCYSGGAAITDSGLPLLYYTSIPNGSKENADAMYDAYQCIATPTDDAYITWDNYSHDIMMMPHKTHDGKTIYDWRDPFIFTYEDEKYMILTGNLNKREGGDSHIFTYKAANSDLNKWDYQGILYSHPNPHLQSMECANLISCSNDDWVLFHSPYDLPEYAIGTMSKDDQGILKFTEITNGIMDYSPDIYAPTAFKATDGRNLVIGWIRGFPENKHWSGCASIPCELTTKDGVLYQRPMREMAQLRSKQYDDFSGDVKSDVVDCITLGNCTEIICHLTNDDAKLYGLTLETEHTQELSINIDLRRFKINNRALHQKNSVDKDHKIHIFVDKSVIEIFVDDRFAFTYVAHNTNDNMTLKAFSRGGSMHINAQAWEIKKVWND